jgi:DNA-binding transcriptional regulator YbjK
VVNHAKRGSPKRQGGTVAVYTAHEARRDLDHLRQQTGAESVNRLAEYLESLEARAVSAERVCVAAAEVVAPSAKRDLVQQRQTRFLRALAEWREAQR